MYKIVIDELVLNKDFKKIDLQHQRKIIRTIRQRLTTKPKEYGESLRGDLKGFWKLRVGEYRVIYEIVEEQVIVSVIKVGLRRDDEAYRAALTRLGSE